MPRERALPDFVNGPAFPRRIGVRGIFTPWPRADDRHLHAPRPALHNSLIRVEDDHLWLCDGELLFLRKHETCTAPARGMRRWPHVPTRERLTDSRFFTIKREANFRVEPVIVGGDPYSARSRRIKVARSGCGGP